MKVTIKQNQKETGLSYPKLMIDESDGMIILFTSDSIGTILDIGTSENHFVGQSGSWHMPLFRDFKGTITIEQ